MFGKIDYGEGQANDVALNLRTRVFQAYDNAGIVSTVNTTSKAICCAAHGIWRRTIKAFRIGQRPWSWNLNYSGAAQRMTRSTGP